MLIPGNIPYNIFLPVKTLGKKSSISYGGEKNSPLYIASFIEGKCQLINAKEHRETGSASA